MRIIFLATMLNIAFFLGAVINISEPDSSDYLSRKINIKEITGNRETLNISASYPFFADKNIFCNKIIEKAVADKVSEKNLPEFWEMIEAERTEIDQSFFEYKEKNLNAFNFTAEVTPEVILDNRYLCLTVFKTMYKGGSAHGISRYENLIIDLQNKCEVDFYELFQTSDDFSEILETKLRNKYDLNADQPLSDKLLIKEFILPKVILIKKDKIQAIYNPYEIDCYAAGIIKLDLEYGLLKYKN